MSTRIMKTSNFGQVARDGKSWKFLHASLLLDMENTACSPAVIHTHGKVYLVGDNLHGGGRVVITDHTTLVQIAV